MGRHLEVEWHESAEELKRQYRQEKQYQRRERLLTFWHLRMGKQIQEVAQMTGTPERVIRRWLAWYREGGLAAVLRRITGHGTTGAPAYLSAIQQKALVARVKLGDLRTVWEVVAWVEARWGIRYSYEGMRSLMKRHHLGLKVPRPQSDKADPKCQESWQKKTYWRS